MQIIEALKPLWGRKSVRGALALLLLMVIITIFTLSGGESTEPDIVGDQTPVVTLTTATDYGGQQSISLVGSVRAFSEAVVTSERAGRVVSVNVNLGQNVSAGTVLATLENASERAAVLQAEGVYDAAVAAAAQSGVSVDEAKTGLLSAQNAAVSTFLSAYNTVNNTVRNSVDDFFSNPDGATPGLRISGQGLTTELNNERVVYQSLLLEWQGKTRTISATSNLETELEYAKQKTQQTIDFLDMFISVFSSQQNSSRYSDDELQAFISTFTSQRSSLIGVQSSVDGALSGLTSAKDTVRKAQLAASGSIASASDAQVKQALGGLRAAEANLAKTILRTPISGVINSLSIRTGDFINSFVPIAVVANNDALEIITFISDTERSRFAVGDEVSIEGAYPGRVANISPAVDRNTKKIEVRIATEGQGIRNGDTVRITKDVEVDENTDETVRVPLTAVKFESENGSVLVVNDNTLMAKPVALGKILGGSVEITSGLAPNELFVTDARGLNAGERVVVKE